MQVSQEEKDLFFNLETKLHKKEVRNSVETVSELIADEFIEFGNSGTIYNKASIISELAGEQEDLNVVVEDFNVSRISEDVVLVTYKSTSTVQAMRSSLWKLIDGRWQMVFHQGSRILS